VPQVNRTVAIRVHPDIGESGGDVLAVRAGLSASLTALVVLLAVLAATVGMGRTGWMAGLACGVLLALAVARGASLGAVETFGPADLVTLGRATLSCGVAALVADSFTRPPAAAVLVSLAAIGLALDAVDGQVARRTRSVSGFGGRFDGEADAFLMLVLSIYVAQSAGAWVLAIGAVRYLFAIAGWLLPWLRVQLPARYWRKVVTGTAGVALTVAAADVTGGPVVSAGLVLAALLLGESFGRDVWWLWRHRPDGASVVAARVDLLRLPVR
jgi:phosphatidylglycerophosphate synthase